MHNRGGISCTVNVCDTVTGEMSNFVDYSLEKIWINQSIAISHISSYNIFSGCAGICTFFNEECK